MGRLRDLLRRRRRNLDRMTALAQQAGLYDEIDRERYDEALREARGERR